MGNYSYTVQYSPNQSSRAYYGYDSTPSGITIHWWGAYGQLHDNVADYLCRPGGNTSAHEVISDGRVTHLIDFDRAAWHSGSTEGNGATIGLECRPEMTAGDLETVAQRCADIEDLLGVSMHYYGHLDWYATSCPGTWYDKITWIVNRVNEIHNGAPSSTPAPSNPGGWPLSGSEYFGPKDGPANCIGGFYAAHRPDIQRIQQRFQELGHAPGYAAWADGIWEPPTTEACQEWERATGRTVDGVIDADDWAALFEEDDMPSAKEVVDELLSRDVFDTPWGSTENPTWNFKNAFESIWYGAYYVGGDVVPAGSGDNALWYGRNALGESVQQGRRIEATLAGLSAAVSALSADAGLTPERVEAIVRDAVAQNIRITGDVEITGEQS